MKSSGVYHVQDMYVISPGAHPLVLALWASCNGSEGTFRHALSRTLQELLTERRKHLRELELARARSLRPNILYLGGEED